MFRKPTLKRLGDAVGVETEGKDGRVHWKKSPHCSSQTELATHFPHSSRGFLPPYRGSFSEEASHPTPVLSKDLAPPALPLKGPGVVVMGWGGVSGFLMHGGGTYAFLMSSADALRGTSRIS